MQQGSQLPVYGQTVGQIQPTPYRGRCVTNGIRVTASLQVAAGGIGVLSGIAAAVLSSTFSYVAIPIWGGLLFFATAGILGLVTFCQPNNRSLMVSYLVMSILSIGLSFSMFWTFVYAAMYDKYNCGPVVADYHWYYCRSPSGARQIIDSVLVLLSAAELACAIIAVCVTSYQLCFCCRECCSCKEEQHAGVVYYAAGGGSVPMVAVQSSDINRPIYIASPATANQSQQLIMQAHPPGQQLVTMPPPAPVQGYQLMPVAPTAPPSGTPAGVNQATPADQLPASYPQNA